LINNGFADWPDWSPDGDQIVYHEVDFSPGHAVGELFIANADGTGSQHLNFGLLPDWSKNGDEVLFLSKNDGDWDIYLINVDGTGLTNLTASRQDADLAPD